MTAVDMAAYMNDRYYSRRLDLIESMGGECVECGSEDRLEFDHIDRRAKAFDIAKRLDSAPLDEIQAEIEKCQLLCRDCHKAKSDREQSVQHGGGASGKKNCKCEPCKARKAEYMREYSRKRRALAKAA